MGTPLSRAATRTALVSLPLLLVSLMAMRPTIEVSWGVEDSCAAGMLLLVAGMPNAVAARPARSSAPRMAVAALILAVFGIAWAQLAVGLFAQRRESGAAGPLGHPQRQQQAVVAR